MIRAFSLVLLVAFPAGAQDLIPVPPLAPDVASLPRLAGDGPTVMRVNAQLAELDRQDLDAVMCNRGGRADDPFRRVDILSDGPEFLSFLIETGGYCEGAAHPWWQQEVVNFDLETGLETDLRSFLPDWLAGASGHEDALSVLFLNEASTLPADCVQTYAARIAEGYLRFDLGVSEAEGGLVLWPQGLAYVETACLESVVIPRARLEEAGTDLRLLAAFGSE